jgi:hypothetical protein
MKINFNINPNLITKLLLTIISVLFIANLISIYLKWVLGYNTALGFVPLFDFDQEYNLPSFYSTLALFFSGVLLLMISKDEAKKVKNTYALHWKILGFIFLFLALDELISLHNHFGRVVSYLIDVSGYLNESRYWVVAYIPFLLVFLVAFYKFFINLPNTTKISFFIAGFVFITGAIGIEILGDLYITYNTTADINYALLYSAEELFEMIGIVLFIRALVHYIGVNSSNPNLYIKVYFSADRENIIDESSIAEEIMEEKTV